MKTHFIISRNDLGISVDLPLIYKSNKFYFYSNGFEGKQIGLISSILVLIDGHVMPRESIINEYDGISQEEFIRNIYLLKGLDFVKYIKGIYNIVLVKNDSFIICNDRHSTKKFFFNSNPEFIFSNKLEYLVKILSPSVDQTSLVKHALFQHFTSGKTMFHNINYSLTASLVYFDKLKLTFNQYWSWKELVFENRSFIKREVFSDLFRKIIKSYYEFFQPESSSMTLTGGRDTRTILSSLLSIGKHPKVFTFGSPDSADAASSKIMASECQLDYEIHHNNIPDKDWYGKLSNEIIGFGNSLIHLHRSHRLDAAKKESVRNPGNNMLFLGMMGGDYIKGAHLDDYIVTAFTREYFFENHKSTDTLNKYIKHNFLRKDKIDINEIDLSEFENLKGKELELAIVENIIAGLHDYQDINIFLEYFRYVMVPFMDIDFLELLFSSTYSLFDNFQTSSNPFRQLKGGDLQCSMIQNLFPILADIPFANRYTPKDLLGNSLVYLSKRILLKVFGKNYPASFSYENWFEGFIKEELYDFHPVMEEIFDIKSLKSSFNNKVHKNFEGYWHPYSNFIMFSKMIKYYL